VVRVGWVGGGVVCGELQSCRDNDNAQRWGKYDHGPSTCIVCVRVAGGGSGWTFLENFLDRVVWEACRMRRVTEGCNGPAGEKGYVQMVIVFRARLPTTIIRPCGENAPAETVRGLM
jgi:hypothetical protein